MKCKIGIGTRVFDSKPDLFLREGYHSDSLGRIVDGIFFGLTLELRDGAEGWAGLGYFPNSVCEMRSRGNGGGLICVLEVARRAGPDYSFPHPPPAHPLRFPTHHP